MLSERQSKLLQTIIQQYIKTAEPIGSEHLAERFNFSPATIRNEMAELTEKGFLAQPHTSAGRVPTEKAYHYYIENFIGDKEPEQKIKQSFRGIKGRKLDEAAIREIGKKMAELTGELTIMASDKDNFYYTGFSYLFSHPEFNQSNIHDISRAVDRLDNILARIFDEIEDEPTILLGRENPFGEVCGAVLARLQFPGQRTHSVIGLLGPMRMDYERNIALINYIRELLSN